LLIKQEHEECCEYELKSRGDHKAPGAHNPNQRGAFDRSEREAIPIKQPAGNASHGVALPYNYWPESRWRLTFDAIGLRIAQWQSQLGLYPFPASLIFERGLHFVAALGIE
jgi:hypothetical protein